MTRLPKAFWRVNIVEGGDKLRTYDRGSKTYASYEHASKAVSDFTRRGIKAEIWGTTPFEWTLIKAVEPDPNQTSLFDLS